MASKKRHGATLDAENEFTSNVDGMVQNAAGTEGIPLQGEFVLQISGTWVGTLTAQRNSGDGFVDVTDNAGNVVTFTGAGTYKDEEPCQDILWRVGFKAGNYTSGSAVVEFQQ